MYHARTKQSCFAELGRPNTVWAISAIHSNINALTDIHDALLERFSPGDRIVYLGNYTGYGREAVETVDELLAFRRLALTVPGVIPEDFTYLRGAQEEMWAKLLQLQFAPNPTDVLLWMLGNGLANTLYAYGVSPHDGIEACRIGVMDVTKWTASIRAAVRARAGHDILAMQLRRAAFTAPDQSYPMLFVHTGIDADKDLGSQGDSFWWASQKFEAISDPYLPFQKVVRGYDPGRKGLSMNCISATLDGGSGFGGTLVCAGFSRTGDVVELFESE